MRNVRDALAGRDRSINRGAVFQRAHHGRADRDDAPVFAQGERDGLFGRDRNAIRLIQRQLSIEVGIAGGRNPRRVSQRRELDAALFELREHLPIERKSRRRRLVSDWRTGNRSPRIPQLQWFAQMSVLNWSPMRGEPAP